MKGNVSRWILSQSGWRMEALLISVDVKEAIDRSLTERNLIVWAPLGWEPLNCFFYGGVELFPSEVLKLEELETEINQIKAQVFPIINEATIEQVAAEHLFLKAKKDRDTFLQAIVARGA